MGIETDVTLNRERGIGGSDIPAIMGDSPFTTRWDLLLYKTGIKANDFEGNDYTRYGQMIEPKIRDYINEIYNANFQPDYTEEETDTPISYYYHSDGCDESIETILEIKSTSQFFADDEDVVLKHYKHYLEQLLYGMWLHGYQKGILAVYCRPEDMDEEFDPFRLQVFEIDMEKYRGFFSEILGELMDFKADWEYLLMHPGISESDLPSRYTLLAAVENDIDVGGKAVPIGWLLQNEKLIADITKDIKKNLCDQMETHRVNSITFNDLGIKITHVSKGEDKTVEKFNETKFAKDHEALYKEYLEEKTQKGKAAYVRVQKQAE